MARPHTTSSVMNLFVLRRLFNRENKGRGTAGETRRSDYHATLTPETSYGLTKLVPIGRGLYGSPVIELSVRVLLAITGFIAMESVAEELALAIQDRQHTATSLMKLARLVSDYKSNE